MKRDKSKLLTALNSLSRAELKHLSNYIQSDMHGYPPAVKKLYAIIEKHLTAEKPLPDNRQLAEMLKQFGTFTDQDIRLFKSYLFKGLEQMLINQELSRLTFMNKVLLIRAFNKKGHYHWAEDEYDMTLQKLQDSAFRNSDYFDTLYKLEEEWYKTRLNASRKEHDFSAMSQGLNNYFLAEKFKLATLEQNYKEILGRVYNDNLLPVLVNYVMEHPQALEEPATAIYFYCYMCYTHTEEGSWFEQLYQLIKNELYRFNSDEQRDIVLLANNFCIRKINKGESAYLDKSFSLYQLGITSGALLEKGYLSRFTYKNIVTLGIRLKQFDWTKNFIEENKSLLERKYQAGSFAYNSACLAYEMKQFDRAIDWLNKADQDDVFIFLSAKNLQMKIYYELQYFDLLEYLLGSVTAFLKRKNIDAIYKTNYMNIVSMIRKLLSLQYLTKSQRLTLDARKDKVRKAITSTPQLTEKKWLLEKLEEIV